MSVLGAVNAPVVLAILALLTFFGWLAGSTRGRPTTGALLGLFLGPLGVVVALFLPRDVV